MKNSISLMVLAFIVLTLPNISFAKGIINNSQLLRTSLETMEKRIKANTVPDPQSYGYKDLKWGMSLKKVKSIFRIDGVVPEVWLDNGENRIWALGNLANAVNGATAIIFREYSEQLRTGANREAISNGPVAYETGLGINAYNLGKRGEELSDRFYNLYLIDDKLVGVEINYRFTPYSKVLAGMIAKYGEAIPVSLIYTTDINAYGGPQEFTASYTAWFTKGNVIVLGQYYIGGTIAFPTVTYININWYYEHLTSFLDENEKE